MIVRNNLDIGRRHLGVGRKHFVIGRNDVATGRVRSPVAGATPELAGVIQTWPVSL